MTTLTRFADRLTGNHVDKRPLILELDLTQGLVEDVAHDPLARAMSRRRPVLREVVEGLQQAAGDPAVRALVAKVGPWRHGLAWAQERRR
jgi:protease-4